MNLIEQLEEKRKEYNDLFEVVEQASSVLLYLENHMSDVAYQIAELEEEIRFEVSQVEVPQLDDDME